MDVIGRMARGGRAPQRLGAVGVMTLLVVLLGAGFVACTPPGGDLEVTYAGGNVGTPSGDVRADFANVGTEPLEGRITVTAAVASGPLELTNAAFSSGGAPGDGGAFTPVGPEISPDGKHLTFHLDGTLAVGSRYQVRIYFKDNFIGPPQGGAPSQYQVAFSHPDDVNPANNSFNVPFV